MSTVETIVRRNLCNTLERPAEDAGALSLEGSLVYDFALSSLDLIMLMTAVCQDASVPLTDLDAEDIARLRTPADIVALLAARVPA